MLLILTFCCLLNQSLLLLAGDNRGVVTRPMQALPTPRPSAFDSLLSSYDSLPEETKDRTKKTLQVTQPTDLADELRTPAPIKKENSIKTLSDIEREAKEMPAEDFHILAKSITQEKKLLEQKEAEQKAQQLQEEIFLQQNPLDPTPAATVATENKPASSFFNQKTVKWGIFISTIAGLCAASFVWKDQISNHMNEIKEQIMELWAQFFTNLSVEKTDIAIEQPNLEVAS